MTNREIALRAAYRVRTIVETNVRIANDESAKIQLEYINLIVEDIRQALQNFEVYAQDDIDAGHSAEDDARHGIDRINAICKALIGED